MTGMGYRVAGAALAAAVAWACAARGSEAVFADRVADYITLRGKAASAAGPVHVTNDAETLRADAAELASRIQNFRSGASEGDVLGNPVAEHIRHSVRTRLSRNDGLGLRERIREVQPEPFMLRVNARYPGDEPRSSTPAEILEILPRVPAVLSYRFVGRALLLLDRNTGVINRHPPRCASAVVTETADSAASPYR